jgi:uncharacterized membrane protein
MGRKHVLRARIAALVLLVDAAGAGPAAATQEYVLPTLFDVAGVAATNQLNVRAGPGMEHPVIARLPADATGVEVVAHDRTGRWGRVTVAEGSGWVFMRYLRYRTDVWEMGGLPDGFRCLGTEPFWSVAPESGDLVLSRPDAAPLRARIGATLDTGIFRDPTRVVTADAEGERRFVLVARPDQCSDGMSDRAYGLSALLLAEEGGLPHLLRGCCRIGR